MKDSTDSIISVISTTAGALAVSVSDCETFLRIASIILAIFYTIVKLRKEIKTK